MRRGTTGVLGPPDCPSKPGGYELSEEQETTVQLLVRSLGSGFNFVWSVKPFAVVHELCDLGHVTIHLHMS